MNSDDLIPIGRFAVLTRLTVRAIRHYHELGLLDPQDIDPSNGYRRYGSDQISTAAAISVLRGVEMPLEDIRALLDADREGRQEALARHRERLHRQLAKATERLDVVDRLMQRGGVVPHEVTIKKLELQHAIVIRERVAAGGMDDFIRSAEPEIDDYLGRAGVRPSGDPFLICPLPHEDGTTDSAIGRPVPSPLGADGRCVPLTLPGGPAACTLHVGPYDQVELAYNAVATWFAENGLDPGSIPREVYLVESERTGDPKRFETELIWPLA